MSKPSTTVPLEIAAGDLADLEEWARNREETVDVLLQEALQQYLRYVRDDSADLERRRAGPWYEHGEAMEILAERRRQGRAQAAE
jgi:hypothetical protein